MDLLGADMCHEVGNDAVLDRVGVLAAAAGMRMAAAVRVTPRVELTGEEDD